ncbi:MAG TPA: acyl-CoA dehydratase activase [Syntrophorhabdaceae bacterium]|nr:acyl-CoA dehydratase activase [Syntrophorhabdaceae bacterium]HRR72379.1 acyl-CoA dehydratase activase [Syntrophorhabdaceae bacterium]
MNVAGLDIGSRTVKLVVLNDGDVVHTKKTINSYDPLEVVFRLLDGVSYDYMVATGYGRHLVGNALSCNTISEIKAFAIGARALYPSCRAVLDIGGQDTKAIYLNEKGELIKFEMNDKCAAGTGRFLEIMAHALNYENIDEFSKAACSVTKAETINSMCTVFAESEVISLIAHGAKREEVALGIHKAIAGRSLSLLKRVAPSGDIVFAGGVALNNCIQRLIAEELKRPVFVPSDPQTVGAYGAALYGQINLSKVNLNFNIKEEVR